MEQVKQSKSDKVLVLLRKPHGTTIADIWIAIGWQAHSCRAFLSGLRKKGCLIGSSKRRDGASCYRIVRKEKAEDQ